MGYIHAVSLPIYQVIISGSSASTNYDSCFRNTVYLIHCSSIVDITMRGLR